MRVSPTLQVTVCRYAAWHWSCAFCIGAALTSLAVWWALLAKPPSGVETALAAASVVVGLVALGRLRSPAVDLRWDSQRWWIDSPDAHLREREVARVEAVIDFSFWMLLRVRLAAARPWAAVVWIPVQRRGLESQWHALRCAVYTSSASTVDSAPQVPPC